MSESLQHDIGGAFNTRTSGGDGALAVDDDEALPAPGTLVGPYRLVTILGSGGMGHVWHAEHVKLGRQVALKMLRRRHAIDSTAVARFFAEARAVNSIRHENIIEVTDFLELPEGSCYVMELLEGQSLAAAMRSEPFPLSRIVDLGVQVAAGMAAVHEASIVHRDLKPDNIFLVPRAGKEFIKLLDFGVAKLAPKDRALETRAGALLGTPEYMAPEQLVGKAVDHRADVYALGVILYELAVGRRPFMGETFGALVLQHSVIEPPPLPASTDARLAALVLRCLAKDPAGRPASMSAIAAELAVLTDEPAPTPSPAPSSGSARRRLAGLLVLGGFAPLAAGAGAVLCLPSPPGARDPDAPQAAPPAPASTAPAFAVSTLSPASPASAPATTPSVTTPSANTASTDAAAPARKLRPAQHAPPATAERVTIRLTSTPGGAEVRDDNGKLLGKTPLALALPRAKGDATFRFRLGALERTASVRRDLDGTASVVFQADGGRSTILSPFAP